jgi:hypothetical protein
MPIAQPPPLESEAGSYASGFQQDFTYENDIVQDGCTIGTSQEVRRIPSAFQIGTLEVDRELGDEEPQEEPPNEPIEIYWDQAISDYDTDDESEQLNEVVQKAEERIAMAKEQLRYSRGKYPNTREFSVVD